MSGSQEHPVVHLELRTRDAADSCSFLTDLLGWRTEHVRLGNRSYLALDLGRRLDGGICEDDAACEGWLPYVEVGDIHRMMERGRDIGAAVILPPREGPVGWRSILATRAGAQIALWQPKR